ncbi:MAG: beta-galactosidase GalB [bacterium]
MKSIDAGIMIHIMWIGLLINFLSFSTTTAQEGRKVEDFNKEWMFMLDDIDEAENPEFNDSQWRKLDLPHDWSVEGEFDEDNPATPGGGALPGGIGWYRKSFRIPVTDKEKLTFIEFDGVYKNGEVWINGHYLGIRPYGYSSFRYELTQYLNYGNKKNVIAVKVDNSKQPNSRWYSGSGIYRNVRLVTNERLYVDHWGTFVTTPEVNEKLASVVVRIKIKNVFKEFKLFTLKTVFYDNTGNKLNVVSTTHTAVSNTVMEIIHGAKIENPNLWSIENPVLYKAVSIIECDGNEVDNYETNFGIRYFDFDVDKGFSLNGKQMKINGVCNHHDLGFLGAAINTRALERQLEIMKGMGVNGIRTSHNPPAPELLDLCDKMGFIVMDEAFDMWKKGKTEFDYSLNWDEWHQRDLEDMVLRDRNHPSIFVWSIGNEILEQWDSTGLTITPELVSIVKSLDTTRPVTSNCNDPKPGNFIIDSGALDLIGFSYHQNDFIKFPETFPGQKFIGSETVSSLMTRGYYDMPSDSIRRWPERWDKPFNDGNPGNTCSSYDNCSAPWGSTQEETWKIIKKYDFLSGQYIWTGFDYLGEPTPYGWPSRSSYFGIVDLAGFPKDAFYLYQSEWTNKPMLHVFPHWNWKEGDLIDVLAYSNCDEVELFLNGFSLGTKKKTGDDLHLKWQIKFTPGTLKAIARTAGKEVLVKEIKTSSAPAKIVLEADRNLINADGTDLSFITVKILDKDGTLIPDADNLVQFKIEGEGKIAGVDNGCQTSMESFKADHRKAFNGLCLVVVQSTENKGKITITAVSEGLESASLAIDSK